MRLVFVTQTLDPADPALAQTLDLVDALAARTDELAVVTRLLRWDAVPANVDVHRFDAPTRPRRVIAFERALAAALREADAVFVHMVPEFLLLAAPLVRLRRLPLLLWYTHWNASRALRLATPLADRVLSVDLSSFPIASPKVRATGHAIDVRLFHGTPPEPHHGPLRMLAVGRTARWKGLATLLEATSLAVGGGLDATLEIRGPSLTPDELSHRAELVAIAERDERLAGRVTFADPVPRSALPGLIAEADVVVSPNEPRRGTTLDKAVFEAAACARPVVSTNAAFAPLLGGLPLPLISPPASPAALADSLTAVGATGTELRASVGAVLRERVVAGHSLDHWADEVISVVREVRSPRGG